jgi:peptide/nickel transport system substrate-binding protein
MRRLLRVLIAASIPWIANGAELRVGLAADVTSMDPHFLNLQPNLNISWHVFDALTHVDEDTRLIPGLAASWRAIDPTTWEFRLRRGVRFHDGAELTAEDVVFSIERTLKVPNGQFRTFTQRIVGKQIVDAHTLRLKTATPYAMVPYDLNSVFIVSRKAAAGALAEDFDSGHAMIGTGPFRFLRFARSDRVELARNDAYWGGKPVWEKVTFRIVPTDPARIAGLLSGELDAIEQVPTADLPRIRRDPSCRPRGRSRGARSFFTWTSAARVPRGSPTSRAGRLRTIRSGTSASGKRSPSRSTGRRSSSASWKALRCRPRTWSRHPCSATRRS